MSDYLSLLERKAEALRPPHDSFRRTLAVREERHRRRRRNRRVTSALLAAAVFSAGLTAALRAFHHHGVPGHRPRPTPIGVAPHGVGPVRSIQVISPSRAVAVTRHAVITTVDSGRHWVDASPRGFRRFVSARVFFLDRDRGWIAAVTTGLNPPGAVTVFRTTDGGGSWARVSLPTPRPVAASLYGQAPQLGFSDARHGWIWFDMVSPSPLLITSDGGASWRRGPSMDSRDQTKSITFTSATEGWAVRDHEIPIDSRTDLEVDLLYRTVNGGGTWERVGLPDPPFDVVPSPRPPAVMLGTPRFFGPEGVLPAWAAQRGSRALFAYVTEDGGATWRATSRIPVKQGLGSPIFPASVDSPSIWHFASTSGRMATTTDVGRTWSVLDLRRVFPRGPSGLAFSTEGTGWALACGSYSGELNDRVDCLDGASGLWRTDDGGATWQLVLGGHRSRP